MSGVKLKTYGRNFWTKTGNKYLKFHGKARGENGLVFRVLRFFVFNHRDTEAPRGRPLPKPEKSELARRRGDRGENLFLFHRSATSALLRARINRGTILLKALAKMRNASDLRYREAIYSGKLCRVA